MIRCILNSIVVVSAEASLSLTDVSEIPDDAELAETFYSQFEDDFENDESDDEAEDEDDFSALMGQMQDALDQTAGGEQTLGDAAELASDGLTDTWRHKRIQGLRAYPSHTNRLFIILLTH